MRRLPKEPNNKPSSHKTRIVLTLLAAMAIPSISHANLTLPVNSSGDEPDASPGDGACDIGDGYTCTLRAAIQEANASTGADRIEINVANIYRSKIGNYENGGSKGDYDISTDMVIIGNMGSSSPSNIRANNQDRVFHIFGNAVVSLENLTIMGGYLNNEATDIPLGAPVSGAGIYADGGSTTFLTNVNITGNAISGGANPAYTVTGGGLYVNADATVFIDSSKIYNNNAPGGGGITNLGHLDIRNTEINNNNGNPVNGGGIRNMGGYLHIGNTQINNNNANLGGGISTTNLGLNVGNVIISNSRLDGNIAGLSGGGIYNLSPTTISNSTISNNQADLKTGLGGGIYNSALGNIDIINSTISLNKATSGGGIFNTRDVSLTNSTVFENSAKRCTGLDCGSNSSTGGNQLSNVSSSGSLATFTLANTIIANGGFNSTPTEPPCSGSPGYQNQMISLGGNLESHNTCGFNTSLPTPDIINSLNVGLDALAYDTNHPATQPVHALLYLSDAVNKGNPSYCPQIDQRYLARDDGLCDIGAYEFGATVDRGKDLVDLKVLMSDTPDPVRPVDQLTYNILLTNLYVNTSAISVTLEIQLPMAFQFSHVRTDSSGIEPDCDPSPDSNGVLICVVSSLAGLSRTEVFVTGKPTAEGTIQASATVTSVTPEAFAANNSAVEETTVDVNAPVTDNFNGGSARDRYGSGGGASAPLTLILLSMLLGIRSLIRRSR